MSFLALPRNQDLIFGGDDLEHLFTFKKFPVFMGTETSSAEDDILEDMSFWISKRSGLIQLNPLLPLNVLYPESHGSGLVGKSWQSHHKEFAKFILQYNPNSVLEIGGGHGILARNYQEFRDIPWTIIEPNPTPVDGCHAKIISGFFDETFICDESIDTIVHSHVFEHMYDPCKFMDDIAKFLATGKMLIFSVPNMRIMLEKKYTNCLNFEHTFYLSEDYIDYLLNKSGFKVVKKSYYMNDHSIFYSALKEKELTSNSPQFAVGLYEKNKHLYLDYIDFHLSLIKAANKAIQCHPNKNIYLFGAHVQAQYLFGFGLNAQPITGILDNDINKHGRRLYGTDKYVMDPICLRDQESPLVFVRAGTFTTEICEQLQAINPSVQLVI